VLEGPCLIDHNLFLHPSDGVNGAQVKLLNPALEHPNSAIRPIRNIEIWNNTFVGNWLCWWNESPVEDVTVHHNVFAIRYRKEPPWPAGVTVQQNTMITLPNSYPNPGQDARWWLGDDCARSSAQLMGSPSFSTNLLASPESSGGRNHAPPTSLLDNEVHATRSSDRVIERAEEPYIGATQPGTNWSMPRPGPRWFDYRSAPATADIPKLLSKHLFSE
jgi:hypothetical protein